MHRTVIGVLCAYATQHGVRAFQKGIACQCHGKWMGIICCQVTVQENAFIPLNET